MNSSDDPTRELKPNWVDYSVAGTRSGLSLVPIIGPFFAEIFGTIIPNQRLDRVVKFIAELNRKVDLKEKRLSDAPVNDEEFTDLVEEAFRQAARSLSDERRSYIATLVANGMNSENIEFAESKHLLRILNEINDVEVIWLCSYRSHSFGGDKEFREMHKAVLTPVEALFSSPPETYYKLALQESYQEHLAQLGLLNRQFKTDTDPDSRTVMPEFDSFSGAMEVSDYELSSLGSLLLREIGLGKD